MTTFYVTDDQVEAMTMADRVAVINRGILQQVDSPQKLYDDPDNLFVAAFIGSPSMNLHGSRPRRCSNGAVASRLASQTLAVPDSVFERKPGSLPMWAAGDGWYPARGLWRCRHRYGSSGGSAYSRAEAHNVEALGFERIVYFEVDAVPVFSEDALDPW